MAGAKGANTCGYLGCDRHIPPHYFVCAEHHKEWRRGRIDQCPRCHRFKESRHELCPVCRAARSIPSWSPAPAIPAKSPPDPLEHSDVRTDGDNGAQEFFVYVLKLDDGDLYVGHTEELRERLFDHRSQKVPSTAGRNPKLQYFEILPSREAAATRESELKSMMDTDARHFWRKLIVFGDLVREVQLE